MLSRIGSVTTEFFTIGDVMVYENIRREKAFDYAELVYQQMLESEDKGWENEPTLTVVDDVADYLRTYDVEHVDVAIWWPDETVTIHSRMVNCIYDIFWRIDGMLDCPVFAKGIQLAPSMASSDLVDHCMHSFTIKLNSKDGTEQDARLQQPWNDPKLFFLKFCNKDLSFDPAKEKKAIQ